MLRKSLLLAVLVGICGQVAAAEPPPPLPVEPTGVIETLPDRYPAEWFLVHDAAFFHMSDGKVYVIDTSKDTVGEQVQGMFPVNLMGSYLQVPSRGEIMSVETFHTRGTRGDRFDVLTIWDNANLAVVAEVELPGSKRFMGMPQRVALRTMNNDRWLAIFNLSPSTSVTLVDLETRAIVSEIPTPGCSFVYGNGDMTFSSVCADGRMLTVVLDEDGAEQSRSFSDVFFDSDDTPVFERP
ncbi:MAG: amine dehydrogenase large subunit, partial [Luminiphilus sp.]